MLKELEYPYDPSYILSKKRSLKKQLLTQTGLVHKKIALLSGSTIGEIKNILGLFLLDNGIEPEFWEGEYARYYEDLVFDNPDLQSFAPDFIYIHTSLRNIQVWPTLTHSKADIQAMLDAELEKIKTYATSALKYDCPVIINNFDLPAYRTLGNKSASDPRGTVHYVQALNLRLAEFVDQTPNLYINDLAYLQATHGIDHFSDNYAWYAYKYCCAIDCIPYLAQSVSSVIKSLLGKNKKALALDMDNTLWGGVVGDDGPEGIVLGNETPAGMAYTEFQAYVKSLAAQGVLLNINSKNEEKNAVAGLNRSDSVLKRDDFLCFKANWEPKHLNLAAMAKELNILPDSFVFVDDNPAEREIVSQQLPSVSCPELSSPEHYISCIDKNGYFEVTTLSQDDIKRSEMYKQNIQREQLQQSFGNYDDYLRSLNMTGEFGCFDIAHAERITQLINKTNQFNLTTRRYTPAEVDALMNGPHYITLYGRLKDKFGDNGITAALIASIDGDTANIDLWIMSCRVFKRKLEHAMFDRLVDICRSKGIKRLIGSYLPTAKNLIMKDFYATIGFRLEKESEDGSRYYSFEIPADYSHLCDVMDIVLL